MSNSNIGIVIPTYNRPEYLKECLDSLKMADIPACTKIVIVDDCSTDTKVHELIDNFNYPDCEKIFFQSSENKSLNNSLLVGFGYCFEAGCKYVINLDSDAIVNNLFITKLISLKKLFPENIITGFNCNTKNKDGSVRHQVLEKFGNYNFKKSVGGVNMCIEKKQYDKWIRPTLEYCLRYEGNWDHKSCIRSYDDGYPIVCMNESVVQHIGVNSVMAHGEPGITDTADDFKPLTLNNVTLVGIDCINFERLFKAAQISCRNINFARVKVLTSLPLTETEMLLCNLSGFKYIFIPPIKTKEEYSEFVMKELVNYIETPYFLLFQHDGFVLNYKAWTKEYLEYDYIGAAWRWYNDEYKVGNGGFSLRSKKLHSILAEDPLIIPINKDCLHKAEDHNICRIYRKYLEDNYKIKFAPEELAEKFSIEAWQSEYKMYRGQFGFHGGNVKFEK